MKASRALTGAKRFSADLLLIVTLYFGVYAFAVVESGLLSQPVFSIPILVGVSLLVSLLGKYNALLSMPMPSYVIIWIIFVTYAALSLYWTPSQAYGQSKLLLFSALGLIPGIGYYIIVNLNDTYTRSSSIVLAGLVAMSIVLVAGSNEFGVGNRFALPGTNPIGIARVSLYAASFALWCRGPRLTFRIATLVAGITVALLTESKGPMLAFMGASIVGGLVLTFRYRSKRNILHMTILSSLILLGAFSWIGLRGFEGVGRFAALVDVQSWSSEVTFTTRFELYRGGVDAFMNAPLIGLGLGGFESLGYVSHYPHNLFIEVASELGIIGLVILGCALVNAYWRLRKSPFGIVMLTQALGYSAFSGDLVSNSLLILWAVIPARIYEGWRVQSR